MYQSINKQVGETMSTDKEMDNSKEENELSVGEDIMNLSQPTNTIVIKIDTNEHNNTHKNIFLAINSANGTGKVDYSDTSKASDDIVYDYGVMMHDNQPALNRNSIIEIRSTYKKRLSKLEDIKCKLDPNSDEEYDIIEDVIELFKEVITICNNHKNKDVLDGECIYEITEIVFKARSQYEDLKSQHKELFI
ncbi:hypothetical protein [Clostridium sp. OS1-26]|uniref:hypothetical protein n=1 Tax=Clostridium sp. OS1-26 TaxID=3070681 RepID=UPI0027DFE4E3|nr:hypothetical protein [Clostridium sp. OS1-26]WML35652.1 hypothetical protein RCG18_02550 [Clostridium sp. OS1-26]